MKLRLVALLLVAALLPPAAHAQQKWPAVNTASITAKASLGIPPSLKADFGAVCDGVTDDAAAFTAATAWMSTGAHREVRIPAATCASSVTVTLGDGRERTTTTSGALSGGETTIAVTSCTGISNGDRAVLVLDSGTFQRLAVTSACTAGSMTVSPAVSDAAASGNVIYTGADSTYNGGGFVGYGSGATSSEIGAPRTVSTIKYIGSAAPTTTLTVTANAADTTVTVASAASITLDTPIGITLDNGRVWWTKPTRTPAALVVTIANEIPSTATSGNAVTIGSNPVVKIAGPIANPRFEGIQLDANNLAAIGLDVMHSIGGKFQGLRGVSAVNYTGIGHFIHAQSANLGAVTGAVDNDFELYALSPQNTKTIGLWFRGSGAGNVCVCRNRFHGGDYTMGGNDVTAAAIREEFADNNTFIKPYTQINGASTSGAGWYRQPVMNRATVGHNTILGGSIIGNITDGTATGGSLPRNNLFLGYNTGDGELIPPATTSASGMTPEGVIFGQFPAWINLCRTGAAVPLTGSTSETSLLSCTVPAGIMGKNGRLVVSALYTYTNSANNKIQRIRFNGMSGTQYVSATTTTTAGVRYLTEIANRGVANSQVGPAMLSFGSAGATTTTTSSVNTANATTLEITGQLADGSETITLESARVDLIPGY